jgi:trans-2,3-dihydro-3-hydroxyanthranilate isomerase
MAISIGFTLVDVFTPVAFGGNQLAVFHKAGRLKASQMQSLAREMNFSESTFVIPPPSRADSVRVRIFTPRREIPMAGHPTIGTTWVLAARGELAPGDATLELGVGEISVTIEGRPRRPQFVWMTHQEAIFGEKRTDRKRIATNRATSGPICRFRRYPRECLSCSFRSRPRTRLRDAYRAKPRCEVCSMVLNRPCRSTCSFADGRREPP